MEGYSTIKEIRQVFNKCLDIVADKDPRYGSMWKKESMDELLGNISRKFKGLEHQFKENGEVDMEFPLDLINYTAFFYMRLLSEDE